MIVANIRSIFTIALLVFCLFLLNYKIAYSVTLEKVKDLANYGEAVDELLIPYGAFYDISDERFYITDCLGEKFIIYSSEGDYLKTVYLEKIGLIDSLTNFFLKNKNDHRMLFKLFTRGHKSESLPADITISNNKIYIVEEYNERVVVYDKAGNFIKKIGSFGYDNYKYNHPLGIFVNDREEIFVVDSDNNRIVKYDHDFNYISEKGNNNTTDLRLILNGPYYGDYNEKKIFITDRYNNRVLAMNDAFEFEFELKNLNYPHDISFDEFDNIYVTDTNNSKIVIYNKSGEQIGQFSEDLYNPKLILYVGNNQFVIGDIGNQEKVLSLYKAVY